MNMHIHVLHGYEKSYVMQCLQGMSTVTLEVCGSTRRESFEEWIVVSVITYYDTVDPH